MVSLLIFRQLDNLSDESVVSKWVENPYYQYFSGETQFQWSMPCDPSDLVHFRNRIGTEGFEKVFQLSVKLQGKNARKKSISIDTTVQEKNITFPTDLKLAVKIIAKCRAIAEKENLELRQSYKRTVKTHLLNQQFKNHPKNKKKALAPAQKIRTIAGRLVRELERKLPEGSVWVTDLDLFRKGFVGDQINALMAASAFNFRRWLRKAKLLPNFLSCLVIYRIMRTELYYFILTKLKTKNLAFH